MLPALINSEILRATRMLPGVKLVSVELVDFSLFFIDLAFFPFILAKVNT